MTLQLPLNFNSSRDVRRAMVLGGRLLLASLMAFLVACGGSSGVSKTSGSKQSPDPVTVDIPIAYIKRVIPKDKDGNPVYPEMLDPLAVNLGAAVFLKDRASVLAEAINISDAVYDQDSSFIKGQPYDVKGLSISSDGKKLLFSMHAPLIANAKPEDQTKWHIWEYDIVQKKLRPIITSAIVAEQGEDLSPQYLADDRILFTSNRQARSKAILLDEGKPQFAAIAEDNDEVAAMALHSMKADGSDIQQLTYNQSHDLQPLVLQSGKVLVTHWDRAGHDNLSFYTANPDGTDLNRYYGFYSLNPALQAMTDPKYRLFNPQETPDGRILALLRADGQSLGGDLVQIDGEHFFENTQRTTLAGGGTEAQTRVSPLPINIIPSTPEQAQFSKHGRYLGAAPLFDGTQRLLVSWSECRLVDPTTKKLLPCTDASLAITGVTEAPPLFGIWVYNTLNNTQQPVVLAEEGVIYEEPVSLEQKATKGFISSKVDSELARENVGLLHIRSVYDIDGSFNSYGVGGVTSLAQMLALPPEQRPARFIRILKPVSFLDEATKDALGDNTYGKLFNGQMTGLREILGYAPVEPDGSVQVKVPADVSFTLEILDAQGRRIGGRHDTWLQLRPGESRECTGCHDTKKTESGHGRKNAEALPVNAGAATTGVQFTNTIRFDPLAVPLSPQMGETMAEFAARTAFCLIKGDPTTCVPITNKAKGTNLRSLSVDLVFDDEWTDTTIRAKSPSFAYRYSALAAVESDIHAPTSESCTEDDGWTSLCRIIINYENHIQPLWERARPVKTTQIDPVTLLPVDVIEDRQCIACHTTSGNTQVPAGQLELTNEKAANNRPMRSFTELTAASNKLILDENGTLTDQIPVCELAPLDLYPDVPTCVIKLDINGKPTCEGVADCPFLQDAVTGAVLLDALGNPTPNRITQRVNALVSRGSAIASQRFFDRITNFNSAVEKVDHRGFMNDSEFKLLREWLDIGGRYYNNPFDNIVTQ